jgi:hypothetical protein
MPHTRWSLTVVVVLLVLLVTLELLEQPWEPLEELLDTVHIAVDKFPLAEVLRTKRQTILVVVVQALAEVLMATLEDLAQVTPLVTEDLVH